MKIFNPFSNKDKDDNTNKDNAENTNKDKKSLSDSFSSFVLKSIEKVTKKENPQVSIVEDNQSPIAINENSETTQKEITQNLREDITGDNVTEKENFGNVFEDIQDSTLTNNNNYQPNESLDVFSNDISSNSSNIDINESKTPDNNHNDNANSFVTTITREDISQTNSNYPPILTQNKPSIVRNTDLMVINNMENSPIISEGSGKEGKTKKGLSLVPQFFVGLKDKAVEKKNAIVKIATDKKEEIVRNREIANQNKRLEKERKEKEKQEKKEKFRKKRYIFDIVIGAISILFYVITASYNLIKGKGVKVLNYITCGAIAIYIIAFVLTIILAFGNRKKLKQSAKVYKAFKRVMVFVNACITITSFFIYGSTTQDPLTLVIPIINIVNFLIHFIAYSLIYFIKTQIKLKKYEQAEREARAKGTLNNNNENIPIITDGENENDNDF